MKEKEINIRANALKLSDQAFHKLPFLLHSLSKQQEEILEYEWSAHSPYEFKYGSNFPIDALREFFDKSNIPYSETLHNNNMKGGE